MLTLKLISEETERVVRGLEKKHFKVLLIMLFLILIIDTLRMK